MVKLIFTHTLTKVAENFNQYKLKNRKQPHKSLVEKVLALRLGTPKQSTNTIYLAQRYFKASEL